MSKHTPGPWRVGFRDGSGQGRTPNTGIYITRDDPENEAIVRGGCIGGSNRCHPAGVLRKDDARLIAAAPELLEALREVCRSSYSSNPDDWLAAIVHAEEAIAKAEGNPTQVGAS